MVGGDTARLRPHVKTHKSPGATRLLLDAGITKFKCATIAEAEMLAGCGAPDILLAYQPVGPKLQRYISLIREYPSTKFACLIDNDKAAMEMDHAFSAAGLRVPVYIDLNVGMNRTGIAPGPAAGLYSTFSQPAHQSSDPAPSGASPISPGIVPIGLHAYDGHIRGHKHGHTYPPLRRSLRGSAGSSGPAEGQGFAEPIIVAGGSPTFSIHCKRREANAAPHFYLLG